MLAFLLLQRSPSIPSVEIQQEQRPRLSTPRQPPAKRSCPPKNHALVLIDFQSQMAFATKSIDAIVLRNNAGPIANGATGFKVPTILTTVAGKSFSGPMFSEITEAFPGQAMLDRAGF